MNGATFTHVINATSFSVDVAQAGDRLVRDLHQGGLAQPNQFGGFALDFATGCLLSSTGVTSSDYFGSP